jgi:CHAT domain-containing protein
MDLLTTTLEDVAAWQKAYINPTEYVDYQEENLDKDEAREAFDKMLGGLVAPLAHHTKAGKLVVLCPSAQLHRLPLHALSIKETHFEAGKSRTTSSALIHRNPCVYTHSHSLLRSSFAATEHTRSSPGPMKPQIMSGIPWSKTLRFEAGRKSIRELALRFHTDPMIDQSALKKDFLAVANHSRLLHLHTHCKWKSEDPLDHEIEFPRLAPLDSSIDERQLVDSVTAREFFDVHLSPGTHVNIIACQGGVTDVRLGDEVMGLGPALLCSGASSIVSTLWCIDDKHGVRFEKDFFDSFLLQCAKKRKKKGAVKAIPNQLGKDDSAVPAKVKNNGAVRLVNLAKAMQAAAKEMDEGESAPLYRWAGYVLHGCWQFTMSEEDAISLQ